MQGPAKKFSLIKPTLETPFHIDFDWWKDSDANWRVFLVGFLCEDHQAAFEGQNDFSEMDAVDPETGEVSKVDALLYTLINHCAQQDDFLSGNLPLVGQIFRTFLSNGNKSLSANQLSPIVNKPAKTILITIGGQRVFKGIRPILKKSP
jgi:hypothetical protein